MVKVIDDIVPPIPAERGQWDAAPHAVRARTDLKSIQITQPEGPSFRIEGNQITWADWTFRFGFDIREGLALHQLCIRDGDVDRPVIYRASIAEMVVPYADPSPIRYWQNYFDQGEYLCGRYSTQAARDLPVFIAEDRSIDGEDVVVWHTFGLTHFPRPEDWPVMPVEHTGFKLKPVGFFDRNPALNVPASAHR